ncbi:Rhamnogalacturonan lyase domain III [Arabidopsis thaliana x Arabidopsis arenosa]|uniref:Rhamnogalacturonan lyase domain III n=1 Tax=Arabidopsis thaliana x Arabidopsis arenosa TaxID=1240361 RepID=A0A8T1Y3X9_9BRAS|nr:Rhamnogalacturonan lyase domain III [Arabidopsis thaliana x Arabidopsis arenosa]
MVLQKKIASLIICFLLLLLLPLSFSKPTRNLDGISARALTVQQIRNRHHGTREVIVDNGIIRVSFSNPQGLVTGIKYKGIDNVLHPHLRARGYWDITWQGTNIRQGGLDRIEGTKFRIISQTQEQVEISFSRTWEDGHIPLNVDKRYIIRRNTSGIYMYGIFERLPEWPELDMGLIRIAFRLNPERFHYMAVADNRQREMPTEDDRDIERGHAKVLGYKEAVQLTHPHNSMFKNQVDDKYQYTCEIKDNKVHGWISTKSRVGFWIISPSGEYRSGGPIKQELTSHVGPTSITTFISGHYVGADMEAHYRPGEAWKKVLGPVFIYLNSDSTGNNPPQDLLWEDAKQQTEKEVKAWPYEFVASSDFLSRRERGIVTGRLLVNDRFLTPGTSAYVGLAPPGEAGSWQTNTKGYQFWTKTNETGYFTIENVRPGTYNLYGWVPGFIGDFRYQNRVNVAAGSHISLGRVVYQPPRNGPTLWEIGVPDRTAREYFIPEPYKNTMNPYLNHTDKFRQYGLWQRYTELYPTHDLVYTVGASNYSQDWFYAHVTRKTGDLTYVPTTWQIVFHLPYVNWRGGYTLQLALASAARANLQVRINTQNSWPFFSTGSIGKDNAIARHGIHGMYRLYSINVPGRLLRTGTNTIYLRQAKATGPFEGLMYDYIRLEEPSRD